MDKEELKKRTKEFSLRIIKMVDKMPKGVASYVVSKQIVRSATSVASNYRAACRAKSDNDFLYKIDIVVEEADETLFWLEIIEESGMIRKALLSNLKKESNELVSIFSATAKTLKRKRSGNHKS
jgi:four helix bundle protein